MLAAGLFFSGVGVREYRKDHRLVWQFAAILLATGPVAPATGESPTPQLPRAVYWKQRVFSVPFQLQRPGDALGAPVEVRPFVSSDGGASWQALGAAKPAARRFRFTAPDDGEYWFSMKTVERDGSLRPANGHRPLLRVIVDTTPPRLELTAQAQSDGTVEIGWQLDELHPSPQIPRFMVRTPKFLLWQPIAVRTLGVTAGPKSSGRVLWTPPQEIEKVVLRALVEDMAGNLTVVHETIALPRPARSPVDEGPAPVAQSGRITPEATQPTRPRRLPAIPPQAGVRFATRPTGNAAVVGPALLPRTGASTRGTPQWRPVPVPSSPQANANAVADHPTEKKSFLPTASSRHPARLPARQQTSPSDPPLQMVNSRRIAIDYELEEIGPTGIALVELWGTTDAGQNWRRFAVDHDHRSPVETTVDGEGDYGFRILVQSAAGFGVAPPTGGDAPDMSVRVDLQPPVVDLVSVQPGSGNLANHLLVRWVAEDAHLDTRPIRLSFSSNPNGPWTIVATGLENTGYYAWQLERHVPDQFYLRIEASDRAGNMGIYRTADPVVLNRPRPTGRIRGARPVR